jgi:TP901 family phage tail tape measure protein
MAAFRHKSLAEMKATAAANKGAMVAAMAAVGVAVGVGLYKVGKEFDNAYDKIQTETGVTGKKLEGLKKDFRAVVKDVPASFDDASAAVAGLHRRLGLTGRPLQERAKQFLELSRITGEDLGESIKVVTRLYGDWGIKMNQQGPVLDKLFRLSQKTGIGVTELSGHMVRFGSPLRQLGLNFDTAAAMFAKFEKEGVNIQTLMPGLKMALKNLSVPTDDLKKKLKELGVAGKDPDVALRAIMKAIKDAPTTMKANALAFQVFGARAGPDMAAAIREGRFELNDLIKQMNGGRETIIGTGEDTMDFSEKLQILKNRGMLALERPSMMVFDGLTKLANVLIWVTDNLGKIPGPVKTFIMVLIGTGGLLFALSKVKAMFIALKLLMMANPYLSVIAATIAVGILIVNNWDKIKTFLSNVLERIKNGVSNAWNAIRNVTRAIWSAISKTIITNVSGIRNFTQDAWQRIKELVTKPARAIRDVVSDIVGAIRSRITNVWTGIRENTSNAWQRIKELVTNPVRTIREIVSNVVGAIRERIANVWTGIRENTNNAWQRIKELIINPIRSAAEWVISRIRTLRDQVSNGFSSIVDTAKNFAGNVKDVIVNAFRGAVNKVINFVNKIIGVINKIPGVDIGKIKPLGAKASSAGADEFARGGAFGRTGGFVRAPIALMGEEAPRHPEFVIPTNPSYRGRARELLALAANKIGFAEGGVVSAFNRAANRSGAGRIAKLALFMAGIVESGLRNLNYGHADSVGALQVRRSTAGPMGIDPMNPGQVAMAFLQRGFWGRGGAIDLATQYSGFSPGWIAQQVQGSAYPDRYDQVASQAAQYVGGGPEGGGIGDIVGALGGVLGKLFSQGASFLLDKLPNPADLLPNWLKGMGSWAVSKIGDWIKDKIKSLFGGSGDDGGKLGGMTPSWDVIGALANKSGLSMTSGYRAGDDGYHGVNRAKDYSNSSKPTRQMLTFANSVATLMGSKMLELIHSPLGWAIKNGKRTAPYAVADHYDHVHTAFGEGGLFGGLPFGGNFAGGGVVGGPRGAPAWAVVHGGEHVSDDDRGGPLVAIGEMNVRETFDEDAWAAKIAWRIRTGAT